MPTQRLYTMSLSPSSLLHRGADGADGLAGRVLALHAGYGLVRDAVHGPSSFMRFGSPL